MYGCQIKRQKTIDQKIGDFIVNGINSWHFKVVKIESDIT